MAAAVAALIPAGDGGTCLAANEATLERAQQPPQWQAQSCVAGSRPLGLATLQACDGVAPSTETGISLSVELMTALSMCTGFGWGGVNFLHSSLYGAMFWICDQNSVGNTLMF